MSRNPWNNRDWSNHPDLIYPDYKSTILRNPRKPLVKLDKIKHIPAPKFQTSSLRPIDADLTLNSKKMDGEIINIGSGKPRTLKSTMRKICREIGKGKLQFGKIKYRKV